MDVTLSIKGFKFEKAECLWLEVGKWTLYYTQAPQPEGFWYRDAWRSRDSAIETAWTIRALNRELIISRAKERTTTTTA